jgi:hypothetical protein
VIFLGILLIFKTSALVAQKANDIALLKNCVEFNFKTTFPLNMQSGQKIKELKRVDAIFYDKFLARWPEFQRAKGYQTIFRVCDLSLAKDVAGYVVVQYVHNNNDSHIYLIYGRRFGELKIFLLAKYLASPIDATFIESRFLKDGSIRQVETYHLSDMTEEYKDSIIRIYSLIGDNLVKTKYDSIRKKIR